jgi:ubiquinone/menaquinone biosynthesis C-methylase UbiE
MPRAEERGFSLDGKGRFVGIDIVRGMIERAKSNILGMSNVEFLQASSTEVR